MPPPAQCGAKPVGGAGGGVWCGGARGATSPISAGKEVRSAVWVLQIVRRDPGT